MRRSLGIVLAALAACSAGQEGAAPTTTSTVRARTTTTTVVETTTTTTEAVPFDIEVRRAAIELLEVRNDVLMHPDVNRVSEYISDTCVCLERERGIVERFVRDGLHWTAPAVTVRGLNIIDGGDPVEPTLSVIAIQPDAAIVHADGSVSEVVPYSDVAAYFVILLRNEDGDWRINGLEGTSFNDQTIAEVLAEGLP